MKRLIITGILALAGVSILAAQQPAAQAAAQPGLKPKSKAEADAIGAMMNTQDPDAQIKAAEDLLTKFADTQFKELALTIEAIAYRSKPDNMKAQVFGERVLEINPKSIQANLLVAEILTETTQDRDLTRDEKLGNAEKMLNVALEGVKATPKQDAKMSDADWETGKKQILGQIHNDFGMLANQRKKYDVAITEFKEAFAGDAQPAYQARLAYAYQSAGKYAEAIAECDTMLKDANLHPQIKQFVTRIKTGSERAAAQKK
jgi:tetratricopeptide (TPR) repeat protein